jgi:SAM-dependent MidA family methyltransferase
MARDYVHSLSRMHEFFSPIHHPVDEPMRQALQQRLQGRDGWLSLADFVDCALYAEGIGYYRQSRRRVGQDADADFYTSASSGRLFASLVVAACVELLADDPAHYTFVELGPEVGQGIIGQLDAHPFGAALAIGPGAALELPAKAVVFANEVLDAQPFQRFIFDGEGWLEAGVRLTDAGVCWQGRPARDVPPQLAGVSARGYTVDWPCGANRLLGRIAQARWSGLWLTLDYGFDLATALQLRPDGSARAYSKHQLMDDFIARPGEVDITCHLIWDPLVEVLREHRFEEPLLQTQEAFFMHHAVQAIAPVISGTDSAAQRDKGSLRQLLHPQLLGRKFHALAARRRL